jgi:hypothetical protein
MDGYCLAWHKSDSFDGCEINDPKKKKCPPGTAGKIGAIGGGSRHFILEGSFNCDTWNPEPMISTPFS